MLPCASLPVHLRWLLDNEVPEAEVVIQVPSGHNSCCGGTPMLVTLTQFLFFFCPLQIVLRPSELTEAYK